MIVLSMIVKNESAVIRRCLESVLPMVDDVVIHDTGSTDDTKDIIRQMVHEDKLFLCDEPWVDYATNRNEALEDARIFCDSENDFILVMDADDVLEAQALPTSPAFDGYQLKYRLGDIEFTRVALLRAGAGWYYEGKVHETLMRRPGDDLRDVPVWNGPARILCNVDGQYKGKEHFVAHAVLLQNETDPRSVFYRAQSWHCAGELEAAIQDYAKRTQMENGYVEEKLVAWLRLGELTQDPGCFLEAAALNSTRAEGLFYAAQWCKQNGFISIAKQLAFEAKEKTSPVGMFVDTPIHTWRAKALWAELAEDVDAAREIVSTPGAVYGPELLELASRR